MKKDKRFLNSLDKELSVLSEKDRRFIVDKYRKIIDEGLSNKKKITTILREIGPVKLVALNEIETIKANKKDNIFKRFVSFITKDLTPQDEAALKEKQKQREEKQKEREKQREENRKLKEEKRTQRAIEREERRVERQKIRDEKKALRDKAREEKRKVNEKIKNANKEEKAELKKAKKEQNKFLKEEKKKLKELEREEKKKLKEEKQKEETKKEETVIENVEEVFEDVTADTVEEIAETHIFESKQARRKRILLTTLGVIITIILIFIWLWITVLAIACGFAYLDGVKFLGLIIAAFAADFLVLWIVVMINRAVFHKKQRVVLNLIISFVCVALIALGIVLFVRKLTSIKSVEDVSDKYSMSTKYDTYVLPSDTNKKLSFVFNANYDTQYIVDYDENMIGKVKVEVKYYEAYYDYYIKKSSNIVYISLKIDDRDRLSTYISDLKDGLIYDSDELSRYVVKIIMAKEDADRIEIIN